MPPHITQFDQVIAPLTREKFLAEYWNRSFLHMKGEAGRFTSLMNWDDLNRILEQHRLSPPQFKLVQDGAFVDPNRYMMADGAHLDLGKVVACLAGGATLSLYAVKELVPGLQPLMQSFQEVLQADNFVNLYAGWRTQKGFDVHWDAQDSVIVQISGRKRWQIFKPTRPFPLDEDVEKPAKPTGQPVWDGLLEDGDALYIPRGWWHVVHPVDVPSLHLTLSSTPPMGIDLLEWVVGRLRRHEIVRRDLPFAADAAGQKTVLAELRGLLVTALDDNAIAEFRDEPLAGALAVPRISLPQAPYEQAAPLMPQTRLRLATIQGIAFTVRADGLMADSLTGGRRWSCPVDIIPALRRLSDRADITLGDLCKGLADETAVSNLKACLNVLARAGIVMAASGG